MLLAPIRAPALRNSSATASVTDCTSSLPLPTINTSSRLAPCRPNHYLSKPGGGGGVRIIPSQGIPRAVKVRSGYIDPALSGPIVGRTQLPWVVFGAQRQKPLATTHGPKAPWGMGSRSTSFNPETCPPRKPYNFVLSQEVFLCEDILLGSTYHLLPLFFKFALRPPTRASTPASEGSKTPREEPLLSMPLIRFSYYSV